jgi:1-acyl-sn-glycerol-3-phosphate acyltransferase
LEIYYFLKAVLGSISKLFWIGKVEGKSNVPRKGAVILAPNHQSWLDFCLLATVVNRRLYFLVGEFAYKLKVAKFALERMGHIKVDRNSPDKSAVYAEAKRILAEGKALVVFPEGRMTRDGKIQKAYTGVARMALASEVDIVPVVMETYHIYSANHRRPLFTKRCKIRFLEPIKHQQIKGKTPAEIVHDLLMPEIAEALGESYDHRHLATKKA